MLKDERQYVREENGVLFYDEDDPLVYNDREFLDHMINRWSIMLGSRDLGNCIIALAATPDDNGKIFDLFYGKYSEGDYILNRSLTLPESEEDELFCGYSFIDR